MQVLDYPINTYSDDQPFQLLVERLEGTGARLRYKINAVDEQFYGLKPDGGMSLKEKVGSMLNWEKQWQLWLLNIMSGKPIISVMQDQVQPHYNAKSMIVLLRTFCEERELLNSMLNEISSDAIDCSSFFQETGSPIRILDLVNLIAENDDLMLLGISRMIKKLSLPAFHSFTG